MFLGKRQVHEMTTLQGGVIRDLAGMVLLLLPFAVWAQPAPILMVALSIMNGGLGVLAIALFYMATRNSFSGATVFGYLTSQLLIVAASSLIFAEWVYFDPRTMHGLLNILALGMTGGAMLVYTKSLALGGNWLKLILVSGVINALGNLISKYVVTHGMGVLAHAFWIQLGLAAGGLLALRLRGQDLRVGKKGIVIGAWQGVLAVVAPMIYVFVLTQHPLSLASMVKRMSTIMVTSLAGLWYYREREKMGKRAWMSLGLALMAFILVMWVNR